MTVKGTPLVGNLPLNLRPSQTPELKRLGVPKDGGYLVDERDVRASQGLISMGLDDNWTFERDFTRIKRVPVHAYDGCTSTSYLLQISRRALSLRN